MPGQPGPRHPSASGCCCGGARGRRRSASASLAAARRWRKAARAVVPPPSVRAVGAVPKRTSHSRAQRRSSVARRDMEVHTRAARQSVAASRQPSTASVISEQRSPSSSALPGACGSRRHCLSCSSSGWARRSCARCTRAPRRLRSELRRVGACPSPPPRACSCGASCQESSCCGALLPPSIACTRSAPPMATHLSSATAAAPSG
mmetsp:Transcript_24001/g.57337  ORF Transcript_24001/g.57337 Transcript_24001/m.57337 type:complete len:205 (+) Transcript_24001:647-1261(+)